MSKGTITSKYNVVQWVYLLIITAYHHIHTQIYIYIYIYTDTRTHRQAYLSIRLRIARASGPLC